MNIFTLDSSLRKNAERLWSDSAIKHKQLIGKRIQGINESIFKDDLAR